MLIPFYMPTLDGDNPCTWAPFGTSLSETKKKTGKRMKSNFSNTKEFSLSFLCEKHDLIADQAIKQTIGCLIDATYLQPANREHIDEQFRLFVNRLADLNNTVIGKAGGFEIYFVATTDLNDQEMARAMEFKKPLILSGFKNVRVDSIKDQTKFAEVVRYRLFNIASLPEAAGLTPDVQT